MAVYDTMVEMLLARKQEKDKGITVIRGEKDETFISYANLYDRAVRLLYVLQQRGIRCKDEVIFQINDEEKLIYTFWACILGGIIPVPLSLANTDDYRIKLVRIWGLLSNPQLITDYQSLAPEKLLHSHPEYNDTIRDIRDKLIAYEDLELCAKEGSIYSEATKVDLAFIQFSSGSTGDPKGVMLTHANILINVADAIEASETTERDSYLSWMPLTHDMGMIGAHIIPILGNIHHYIMPTALFIRRPRLWLMKATEHQATVLMCPNFGYKFFLSSFDENVAANLELSKVRLIYNGAEPISTDLCNQFTDRLSPFGLRKNCILTVYGLAEATVAVAFSKCGEPIKSFYLDRRFLNVGNSIIEVASSDKDAVSFVEVGSPIRRCQVRITDADNELIHDGKIGLIQINGANVTSGYYNAPGSMDSVRTLDGWLNTGDLGFMRNGKLIITGRAKDIIFINGQNIYPHDLERVAEGIEGIELGKVAACGIYNKNTGTDDILLFVLFKNPLDWFVPIALQLKGIINLQCGFDVRAVLPIRRIPKTTSGKIQRFLLAQRYIQGEFDQIYLDLERKLKTRPDFHDIGLPKTATEKSLVSIWSGVLNRNSISKTDHFFEIGGNSIKASQVLAKIRSFLHVELQMESLFQYPTIELLAKEVEKQDLISMPVPVKAEGRGLFPLTSAQKRLFVLSQYDTGTGYNLPWVFTLAGPLNVTRFINCCKQLFARHDVFRTSFEFEEGVLVQRVHCDNAVSIDVDYINAAESEIDGIIAAFLQPFDLQHYPLWRATLVQTDEERFYFLLDVHHIISDGTSMGILMDELTKLYKDEQLPLLSLQYADFVCWQEQLLLDPVYVEKQERFWLKVLEGELPVLDFPTDYPRKRERKFSGDLFKMEVSHGLLNSLSDLALKNRTTLFTVLFAAYHALLHKYTDQEDVIVGTLLAGRLNEEFLDSVGMFVNTVAVRSRPESGKNFLQLVEEMQEMMLQVFEHQEYPFEEILHKLNIKRDLSRNPLFDTMFVLQNMHAEVMQLENVHVIEKPIDNKVSRFDLTWYVIEKNNGLQIEIEYSTDLFMQSTIERMGRHYIDLLGQIVAFPEVKLGDMQLGTEQELQQIETQFQLTTPVGPRWSTLQEAFEDQAARLPDRPAITCERRTLTYRQLNQASNQLARMLRKRGVKSSTLVPLLLDRSCDMIIAQLAVWKAGGAFVPIDPDYPAERIRWMLENSGADLVVTNQGIQTDITFSGEFIMTDDPAIMKEEISNLVPINQPEDPAYLIYTSGSTGLPKGVMVEHRNLLSVSESWSQVYNLSEMPVRLLQLASFSFDVSVGDLVRALFNGGQMFICPQEIKLDIKRLAGYIQEHRITLFESVPSLIIPLLEYIHNYEQLPEELQLIILGSDVCPKADFVKIAERFGEKCRIINSYGVTEATIDSSYYEFCGTDISYESVPIGKPMPHARMYIVDRFGKLLPVGVPGELCIGGTGVSRGYLNTAQHLQEKFVPDRFLPGSVMYRTGDMAKWNADGNIVFIGRNDHQIKLNGYRIETGEVEACLLEHSLISHAAVTAVGSVLCGYYIACEALPINEAQRFLLDRLPYYMVPASLMQLASFPLTTNGKVDKQSLPKPQLGTNSSNVEMPRNETEKILAGVWKEVLGIAGDLSVTDNYFALGGDSIKAIQIIGKLYRYNLQVELKSILKYPTIQYLSQHVVKMDDQLEEEPITGEIPLLPIQKWFFDRTPANVNHWNQAVLLYGRKGYQEKFIREAFQYVAHHHQILRMSFTSEDEKVTGLLPENAGTDIPLSVYYDLESKEMQEAINKLHQGLDLKKGLLFRLGLFHQQEGDYLCVIIHHLVVDGVSWRILLEDFHTCYEGLCRYERAVLPKKTASIQKWAESMAHYAAGNEILAEIPYWADVERQAAKWVEPVFVMDSNKQATFSKSRSHMVNLDEHTTKTFTNEARRIYHMELGEMILAALSLALSDWAGSKHVLLQSEGHGRELEGINVSRTVGWFTSLFPVMLEIDNDIDLYNQLKAIKREIRRIPNKGFGYEILKYLVPRSKTEGVLNFSLTPRVSFNYLGQFDQDSAGLETQLSFSSTDEWISPDNERPFSLDINAYLSGGCLTFVFNYDTIEYSDEELILLAEQLQSRVIEINGTTDEPNRVLLEPTDFQAALCVEDVDYIASRFLGRVDDIYPLSPSQQGILYHVQAQPENEFYHQQMTFHWEGPLQQPMLIQALEVLISRHPALRTVFLYEDVTTPLQVVLKPNVTSIDYRNLTGLHSDKENAVNQYKDEARLKGFELASLPPLRISLLQTAEHSYSFIWDVHHLLFDGWSVGIIMEEFFSIYAHLVQGKTLTLPPSLPFSEYINWLEQKDDSKAARYWGQYLDGYEQTASMLVHKSSYLPASGRYNPADYRYKLPKAIFQSLLEYSMNLEMTLNQALQAIWGILLSKYNQTEDVIFGSVMSGRPSHLQGADRSVGLYINTVPVRVSYHSYTTIRELMHTTREHALQNEEEQHYPLYEMQNLSAIKGPLFDHVLIFENYPLERNFLDQLSNTLGITLRMDELFELTNYDLNVVVYPGEELEFHFRYNSYVYGRDFFERLTDQLQRAMQFVIHNPQAIVKDIMVWSSDELAQPVVSQQLPMEYVTNTTIYQLFEKQVLRNPYKTALRYGEKSMSFDELNRCSNRLAFYLRSRYSIGPDVAVGIMCKPSESMIVALLAILKAGGAYVPLDPAYPEARIRHIIADSQIDLLLMEDSLASPYAEELECLDIRLTGALENISDANLRPLSNQDHLAYIIYTSGTTGSPKGVMVEHGNVLHLFAGMNQALPLAEQDVMLAVTSISFDISVLELFWTLTNGNTVVLKDSGISESLEGFDNYLNTGKQRMEFNQFFYTSNGYNSVGEAPLNITRDYIQIQQYPSMLITTAGTREHFIRAAELGANILIHMREQESEVLEENIALYRRTLQVNGFDPQTRKISLILYTFISSAMDDVKDTVKDSFYGYLRSSTSLLKNLADTTGIQLLDESTPVPADHMYPSFEQYWQTAALVGTPESCGELVDRLLLAGINEITCLIDLSMAHELVVNSLDLLSHLKKSFESVPTETITILQSTPSRLKLLAEDPFSKKLLRSLKTLLVGGEVLPLPLLKALQSKTDAKIFNMYGPTETTVWSSIEEINNGMEMLSLGTPIGNTEMYVLDRYQKPLPAGITGEIYIGGPGVVRGYMNRGDLTEERFVKPAGLDSRIYKTGDLGCILENGKIEFAGRADYQVKIRGYRIELGEIEKALIEHDQIQQAVVLVHTDENGDKELCSYLVCSIEPDSQEIRKFLKQRLPEYMVPSFTVFLEELPVTSNGKVDRNTLSKLKVTNISRTDSLVLAANETEKKLVLLFQEILMLDRIGIHDNFFELGGHSIKATNLASRIKKQFHIDLPVRVVFENPTVLELATYIAQTVKQISNPVMKAADKLPYYPLSSAQIRMFAFNQMHNYSTAYNMPELLELEGTVDISRLERAVMGLIERHEALRTSFGFENGIPVQYIHEHVPFTLPQRVYELEDASDIHNIYKTSVRPFDLGSAPLLRMELWTVNRQHSFLMVDMHHIITDGASQTILLHELLKLYENMKLESQQYQYKDFSVWQNSMLASSDLNSQKEYWMNLLSGKIPELNLPADFMRPDRLNYEGMTIRFTLEKELRDRLREVNNRHHSTWFMLLLSIFKILLSRISGQQDIIVGTVTAGRTNVEHETIIGIFLNTLFIRTQPSGGKRFIDLLNEVKEASLSAFEHQQYPFEALINDLGINPATNRNPVFDVLFIMQNIETDSNFELGSLGLKHSGPDMVTAKVDLKLEAYEDGDEIHLRMDYMTQLFKKETVERFVQLFISIADTISRDPERLLQEIELLSYFEKTGMLQQFNECLEDE